MTQPNALPAINFDPPKDNRHPLIRFTGTMSKHETIINEPNEQYNRTKQTQSKKFYFQDVVVMESHEPYPFPITDVTIPHSTAANTRWAVFTASLRTLVPATAYEGLSDPFDALVGKKQEWFFKPADLRMPLRDPETGEDVLDMSGKQKWGITSADAWQVMNIEGFNMSGKSLMETIVDGIDGKDDKGFLDWLFNEQSLKSLPGFNDVVDAATDRKLIPSLIEAGKIELGSDGKYAKVATE